MRGVFRALPRVFLPAAMGLGLAYLATGFLPAPAAVLRPPEAYLAHGLTLDEESPARAVLEHNVLRLKSPPLAPPSTPLAPPETPDAATAALEGALPPGVNATAQRMAGLVAPIPAFGTDNATTSGTRSGAAKPSPSAAGRMSPDAGRMGAAIAVSPPLSGGPSVRGPVVKPK